MPLGPCREFILAREFLFANERLASHSYPPWGNGVGDPFIYSRSKQKKITDRVTIAPLDWGDGGIFLALSVTCKKTPWAHEQRKTLFVLCLSLKQDSASHQTWQPPEWRVIWLRRRRLCTRRQPRSTRGFMCEHAHTRTNKKRDLCVFFSPVALMKLQLWIIHSDWMKVTLWFQGTFKYTVLLNIILRYILSVFTLKHSHTLFVQSYSLSYTIISFLWMGKHSLKSWHVVYITYIKCKGLLKITRMGEGVREGWGLCISTGGKVVSR